MSSLVLKDSVKPPSQILFPFMCNSRWYEWPTGVTCLSLRLLCSPLADTLSIIDYELMGVNFLPFDVAAFLRILSSSHILPGMFCPLPSV